MNPQAVKQVREYTDHLEHIEHKTREAAQHTETNLNERDALRRMADALNVARREAARVLLGLVDEGCC
jgi:hypothetical protein